jgi:hypothetical protein
MPEDNVSVPKSLWDQLTSVFKAPVPQTPAPPVVPEKVIKPEEFAAIVTERDTLKAQIQKEENDKQRTAVVTSLVAELQTKSEKGVQLFGATFAGAKKSQESADVLAGMTKDQRDWVMQNFKAYAAQIDATKITSELGKTGADGETNPVEAFNAVVMAKSVSMKVDYVAALQAVAIEQPDLYKAYVASKKENK